MKSLSTLSKNNYIHNIDEALSNNVRLINEAQLIINNGKDLDSLLYKFNKYTTNNLYHYNTLNESSSQYKLTVSEAQTFKDLMIYMCEEYRASLLEELHIYESIINNDNILVEGFLDKIKATSDNIVDNVKKTWEAGKENVAKAITYLKTKISAVNDLIKKYATKAISTIKDMAMHLISLLDKLDCTLEGLVEKIGFNVKHEAETVDTIGAKLAKNVQVVVKNDVYEAYSQKLKDEMLLEAEEASDGEPKTIEQAKKKGLKQMLWEGFKQMMIWAGVCVVIPGIVCGLFPGTFIALLVPMACKLLWNGYKIVKLWKQWKKVREEWGTYKRYQKVLTAIGMACSIITVCFNFGSVLNNIGKVWEAFSKTSAGLFEQANLGMQPDMLTRGVAAAVQNIKEGKWPWEDFGKAYSSITDAFAEHIPQPPKEVGIKMEFGKTGEEAMKTFDGTKYPSSTAAVRAFKAMGIDPDKIPPGAKIDVVFDGHPSSPAVKGMMKWFADHGYKPNIDSGFNDILNNMHSNAGSMYALKDMPVEVLKKAMKEGVKLGHNDFFSVIGGTVDTLQQVAQPDIINAATSMLMTIPSVEFAPQNNGGFRVRLGGEDDKDNYVYEVDDDGVVEDKASSYAKQYDKIKEKLTNVNKKFFDELQSNKKIDDEKKKEIMDSLEEFNKKYQKEVDDQRVVVVYGIRVKEETNEAEEKPVPILIFANAYGMDIADATSSGPRADIYPLKGIFEYLTFSEIKGGTSAKNMKKLLGDILGTQVISLYNIAANKPCSDDKKRELNKWNDANTEREDFGMLTNQEITDLLNNTDKSQDYVLDASKVKVATTKEDKQVIAEKTKEYDEKLEKPSEEVVEIVKEIDKDAVDDKGNIKPEKRAEISKDLASYGLAMQKQREARKKSGGGFFNKLKLFISWLFAGRRTRAAKYRRLMNALNGNANESLSREDQEILNEVFGRTSLKDYILENTK